VIEHLPSKWEALSSKPNTAKKKGYVNVVSFYLKYLVLDLAFETMCDDTMHSDGK
jgi:hypothetical protein